MYGRLLEESQSADTINDISYLDDTKINNLLFADDLTIFTVKRDLAKNNITVRAILQFNLSKTKKKRRFLTNKEQLQGNFTFKGKKSK